MRRTIFLLLLLLTFSLTTFAQDDWPGYARDYASTSFSTLKDITPANVSKLKQVCSYPVPENATFESSLVVVNGIMYFTTGAYTYALNAADCTLKWGFKTPVTKVENIEAPLTPEGTHFCPGTAGGVQWNGQSFSPATNLVYVNSVDWCSFVKLDPKLPVFGPGQFLGTTNGFGVKDERKAGWVTAVDADSGMVRWKQEMATPMVAGTTVTGSGLVLTGDLNGDVIAFDAATGKILHRIPTQQPIGGGVVTYKAGGKQLVGVAAGLADAIMQTKGTPVVFVFGL